MTFGPKVGTQQLGPRGLRIAREMPSQAGIWNEKPESWTVLDQSSPRDSCSQRSTGTGLPADVIDVSLATRRWKTARWAIGQWSSIWGEFRQASTESCLALH
jgi:hypothetical protein